MVAQTEELNWEAYERLLGQTEGQGYRFHENVGELIDTLRRYEEGYPQNVNDKVLRWHNDIGYLTGSTLSNIRRYIDGRINLQTFNEYIKTTLENITITPDSVLLAVEESQSFQETVHHTMFILEMLKKQPPTLLYDCKRKSLEEIEREEKETGKKKTISKVIGKQLGELQREAQREEKRQAEELEKEAEKDRREFRKDYRTEMTKTPQPTAEEVEAERERTIWRRENKRRYGALEPKGHTIPDAMDYIMTFLQRVDTPAPVKSLKGDMIVKGFTEDEIESSIDNLIMDGEVRVGEMPLLGEVIAPYKEPSRRRPSRRDGRREREVKEAEFEELPSRQIPLPLPEAKGITIGDTFLREIDENTYEFETNRGRFRVRDLGEFGYKLERIA